MICGGKDIEMEIQRERVKTESERGVSIIGERGID